MLRGVAAASLVAEQMQHDEVGLLERAHARPDDRPPAVEGEPREPAAVAVEAVAVVAAIELALALLTGPQAGALGLDDGGHGSLAAGLGCLGARSGLGAEQSARDGRQVVHPVPSVACRDDDHAFPASRRDGQGRAVVDLARVAPGNAAREVEGEDPEPERRAEALHTLAYLGTPELGMPTLELALADPDESVRERALELLKDTADGVPFDALIHMARGDRSPRLRVAAPALLAEREDVRAVAVLRLGLNNPARVVRERAQALLDDWESARGRFTLVLPRDYQRVLDVRAEAVAEGLDADGPDVWNRIMEASHG